MCRKKCRETTTANRSPKFQLIHTKIRGGAGLITITAFKMVPPFAQGVVRDLRVRWALEEAGLPYEAKLIDPNVQASAEYRG